MFTGKIHAIKRLRELVQNAAIQEARELREGGSCPTRLSEIGIQLRTAKEFVDECYDSAKAEPNNDPNRYDWMLVAANNKVMKFFTGYTPIEAEDVAVKWLTTENKNDLPFRLCRIYADMVATVTVSVAKR